MDLKVNDKLLDVYPEFERILKICNAKIYLTKDSLMTESFFNMYSGHFGKKLAQEAVMVIYWCRTNLSEKEIDKLVKNSSLPKDKIFGDKL